MKKEASLSEKALLTLEEASAYFNIGVCKMRELTNDENCPYVLWNGSKRLIKRKPFEEFLYRSYSV
jgi:excisionase family DNA binding protein